jgi:hypothetical protein
MVVTSTRPDTPSGPPADLLGDRYKLGEAIGRGRSTVYRAEDVRLRRPVAVKQVRLFDGGPEDSSGIRRRTMREAHATARLSDPHVVTVFDVIEEGDSIWLVMELIDAPSLSRLVADSGPLAPERVARIGLDVLSALTAAHAVGVVHRDVKPANVMVLANDRAKLADFGVAKMRDDTQVTAAGLVIGSPAYMAPEQARAERAGPAADMWSLGATLYFAVEGLSPFPGNNAIAVATAVIYGLPRPVERAGPLAPLLTKLLAKEPTDRPSAAEVRRALRDVASTAAKAGRTGVTASASADDTLVAPRPEAPAAPPLPPGAPKHSGGAWRRRITAERRPDRRSAGPSSPGSPAAPPASSAASASPDTTVAMGTGAGSPQPAAPAGGGGAPGIAEWLAAANRAGADDTAAPGATPADAGRGAGAPAAPDGDLAATAQPVPAGDTGDGDGDVTGAAPATAGTSPGSGPPHTESDPAERTMPAEPGTPAEPGATAEPSAPVEAATPAELVTPAEAAAPAEPGTAAEAGATPEPSGTAETVTRAEAGRQAEAGERAGRGAPGEGGGSGEQPGLGGSGEESEQPAPERPDEADAAGDRGEPATIVIEDDARPALGVAVPPDRAGRSTAVGRRSVPENPDTIVIDDSAPGERTSSPLAGRPLAPVPPAAAAGPGAPGEAGTAAGFIAPPWRRDVRQPVSQLDSGEHPPIVIENDERPALGVAAPRPGPSGVAAGPPAARRDPASPERGRALDAGSPAYGPGRAYGAPGAGRGEPTRGPGGGEPAYGGAGAVAAAAARPGRPSGAGGAAGAGAGRASGPTREPAGRPKPLIRTIDGSGAGRRRPVTAALVVVAALLLGALAVHAATGDGGEDAGDSPSTTAPVTTAKPATTGATTATTMPSTTTTSGVPEGWVTYTDPSGAYTIAHPPDWTVESGGGPRTKFREPGTGTYLMVDWTPSPGVDPVADWQSQSGAFAGRHSGYRTVRIDRATYRDYDAAIWEFGYEDGGAVLHVGNLGFVAGGRGYALYFQTHEENWAASQDLFHQFQQAFRPAGGA